MKLAALVVLSLIVGALACSGRSRKDEPVMTDGEQAITDAAMIERVRNAVVGRIPPAKLEAFVEQKAMVNTTTGFPLEGLRRVNLIPDPEHAEHTLKLDTAAAVVYFGRPVESDDPKIVGVQYGRDGSAALFFAILLPP